MTNEKRHLLTVLREELAFVERGGYRNTSEKAWRPLFIFQDSPTCLNHDPTQPPKPCSECPLMQLIPAKHRDGKIPCRQIPLNDQGETIDSFYRLGTRDELEAALRGWLKKTIHRLETENAHSLAGCDPTVSEIHVRAKSARAA